MSENSSKLALTGSSAPAVPHQQPHTPPPQPWQHREWLLAQKGNYLIITKKLASITEPGDLMAANSN